MPDGSFNGFEGGGIFVKTEGVDAGNQTEIFYGLLKENTLCENVYVTDDGDMDLYNYEITSNGRAVICRRDFMHASRHISVDRVDNLILITRGAIIPAISKMNLEEAMAMMVLGLSIESSAGNPEKAGSVRSVFFYDPFMSGDKGEHANRLYEILSNLPHVNYYLLNTGGVGMGERYKDISLNYTMSILDSLIRGGLTSWIESPAGFKVPTSIRGVDPIYFHPERLFSIREFRKRVNRLNKLRSEKLDGIDGLNPGIKNVFKRQ
jgi:phosphoenolpyruvate carboxykinase (ATP)